MSNYLCKKFFDTTYRLATIHPLQTDRQTDRWHIVPKIPYSLAVVCQKL